MPVVDIRVRFCLFVMCISIYIRLVMSSYLLFCCTKYLFRCLVYHMLSKTRNSRSLHRVIAYICYTVSTLIFGVSHAVEVSVLCLLVVV